MCRASARRGGCPLGPPPHGLKTGGYRLAFILCMRYTTVITNTACAITHHDGLCARWCRPTDCMAHTLHGCARVRSLAVLRKPGTPAPDVSLVCHGRTGTN